MILVGVSPRSFLWLWTWPQAGYIVQHKKWIANKPWSARLKVGSYWTDNRKPGQKAYASTTLLLDPDTGYVKALLDASHITALPTAAAVAIRHLSLHDGSAPATFEAGHQE